MSEREREREKNCKYNGQKKNNLASAGGKRKKENQIIGKDYITFFQNFIL